MTKEELKKWLPEINHWINGGDLYAYGLIDDTWTLKIGDIFRTDQIYVIKDRHFEARKAFALGEPIEISDNTSVCDGSDEWLDTDSPSWNDEYIYRPKPKKPIYEWQWYDAPHLNEVYELSKEHWTEAEVNNISWNRFEPSKRIRK